MSGAANGATGNFTNSPIVGTYQTTNYTFTATYSAAPNGGVTLNYRTPARGTMIAIR